MNQNAQKKKKQPLKDAGTFLMIGVIVGVVLSALSFTHVYQDQEASLYDWRFRLRNTLFEKPAQYDKISTIDIDDLALQTYGWPLTRNWHARLIDVLHTYNAAMIGFDIFFYEPSGQLLSPEEIAALETETLTKSDILALIKDYDRDLRESMQRTNIAYLTQTFEVVDDDVENPLEFARNNLRQRTPEKEQALSLLRRFSIPITDPDIANTFFNTTDIEIPIAPLAEVSRGIGFAMPRPDHDGIVRRYRLGVIYDGRFYFSLGFIMACDYLGVPLENVKFAPGKYVEMPHAKFPDGRVAHVRIPVLGTGEMLVNWAGPYHHTFQHMPFNLILDFAESNPRNKALKAAKRVIATDPETLDNPSLYLQKMRAEGISDLPDEMLLGLADQLSLFQYMESFLTENPEQPIEAFVASLGIPHADIAAYAESWAAPFSQIAWNLRVLKVLENAPNMPLKAVGDALGISRLEDIKYSVGVMRDLLRKEGVHPEPHPLYFEDFITSAGMHGDQQTDRIISEEDFRNTVFFYGLTATGTHDLNPTPFGAREAMLGAHVNVFNTIITQNFLKRVPPWANAAIMIAFGLLIGFLVPRFKAIPGAAVMGALLLTYLVIAFLVFAKSGIWIDALGPIATLVLGYLSITLYNYIQKEKEKEFVQGAFGHYLDPKVISQIVDNPQLLGQLGGDARIMTAYFSDVASFSAISENLTPVQLVETINEYLTEMCEIIAAHDGTIDKFEGDAIVAFWGAPIYQDDHARSAVLAAVDMQNRMVELRQKWVDEGKMVALRQKWADEGRGTFFFIRMGINTGEMVVGNMGSKSRIDYTMLGDAVNLAARLESGGKAYGVGTMIAESTYLAARDLIEARQLDTIRVVGKEEPVRVFEVLGHKGQVDPQKMQVVDLFAQGVVRYRERKWDEAISFFEQGLKIDPTDGPSSVYIKRCKLFQENPPPESWDAVHTLESK